MYIVMYVAFGSDDSDIRHPLGHIRNLKNLLVIKDLGGTRSYFLKQDFKKGESLFVQRRTVNHPV